MAYVHVTRRYRFSASHRLHSPLLTEEENYDTFGKCNNPFGHGHDYTLDVTVAGELDRKTGRLLPVAQLDELVKRVVTGPLDRRDLNSEAPEFADVVPTTENLARVIAARLGAAWRLAFPGHRASLAKIRIWETRNNIFDVSCPTAGQAEHGSGEAVTGAARENV